ncbi:MAG: proC [Gammaproteobacteria bacterium]|jgi:pyrroline-5-carboxylate reductase|nr:proC [Gammaproteobacteria bacterium]
MSKKITIAFIGAGNMAANLIGGLIRNGYPAHSIWATRRNEDKLEELAVRFGIHTTSDNRAASEAADIIILAVKPQQLQTVCHSLRDQVQSKKPLVISIAAGIEQETIAKWLGADSVAIIRLMPNTPSLVGCGASILFANRVTTSEQRDSAQSIASAVGKAVWLEEETQMAAATALSGSGPAYFYLFMEYLMKAAVTMGLAAETAELLTLQTALGAAKMAIESGLSVAELRAQVASPQGTTAEAINVFNRKQLDVIIQEAVESAKSRSIAIAEEFRKK